MPDSVRVGDSGCSPWYAQGVPGDLRHEVGAGLILAGPIQRDSRASGQPAWGQANDGERVGSIQAQPLRELQLHLIRLRIVDGSSHLDANPVRVSHLVVGRVLSPGR